MELVLGSYLAERFQILDCVSSSDATPTYLAADRRNQEALGSLQVLVALRLIDIQKVDTDKLKGDINTLSDLKNDHIFKTYELIQESSISAVSSEYVLRTPLADKMPKELFSTEELLATLIQIAKGLEALHSKEIFHGNINERTIYIDNNGTTKIDPLARGTSANLNALADINALGVLGLALAEAKDYLPKLKKLDCLSATCIIETSHPKELLSLLKNLSGLENSRMKFNNIKIARRALERIAATIKSENNYKPHLLKVVFSGRLALIAYICILTIVFTVLTYIAYQLVS